MAELKENLMKKKLSEPSKLFLESFCTVHLW